MRVAVLSDIHGNYIALESCIEEIQRRNIDKIIFLGDYVGELAYPQRTMALIRSIEKNYECYFVRGNKEDYWIHYKNNRKTEWKDHDSTTGSLLYTYNNLTSEDISFFESLPYMKEICYTEMPVLAAYHGSHDKNGKKLKLNTNQEEVLFQDTDAPVILCGHTHIRAEIKQDGQILLNPGSVGVPLKSNGKSQFMILTGNNGIWSYEFIDLPYDIEKVICELKEEDLYTKAPCWSKITENLLRNGDISHGTVLERAMQYLYNDTGEWRWPDIPEEYWEKAVEELIGNRC